MAHTAAATAVALVLAATVLALLSHPASAVAATPSDSAGKCHILALGAGGDRGAYEAGVLKGLLEKQPDVAYGYVSGNSAGAINAAALSMYPPDQTAQGIEYLLETWPKVHRSTIYQNWPGSVVEGFFMKSGLFNTAPLRDFLKHQPLDRIKTSGRKLSIGATSLNEAKYVEYHEDTNHIVDAVMASSAVPSVFPVIEFANRVHCDGGVSSMTPVSSSVHRCIQDGFAESDIMIDVVLAVGGPAQPKNTTLLTPMILLRSLDLVIHDVFAADLRHTTTAFPDVHIRLFYPSVSLPGWFLGFDHTQEMIEIGYKDAIRSFEADAIELTPDLLRRFEQRQPQYPA